MECEVEKPYNSSKIIINILYLKKFLIENKNGDLTKDVVIHYFSILQYMLCTQNYAHCLTFELNLNR